MGDNPDQKEGMQMKEPLRILVAGGDRRQKYAAQMLAQQPACSVTIIGFSLPIPSELPETDVLLLPIHTDSKSVPSPHG